MATPADAPTLPPPLRTSGDRDELAQRAQKAAQDMSRHARSPLVDARFVDGLAGLARALDGLAAMRANEFAPQLAEDLAARLAPLVAQAEQAIDAARPALEGKPAGARGSARRARPPRAGTAPPAPAPPPEGA
jgi:hypothetical protein